MLHTVDKSDYKNTSFITNILFIPHDRIVRLPLQEWARLILYNYASIEAKEKNLQDNNNEFTIECAVCFNQAALIEFYLGRIDNAISLCSSQLLWANHIAKSELEVLDISLQPWINLGRIDYFAGRYNQALHKFYILFHEEEHTEPNFYFIVTKKKLAEIKQKNLSIKSVIENVFIVDSLKAMLKGKYYNEIINFTKTYNCIDNVELKNFMSEAKIVALCRNGQRDEALTTVNTQIAKCIGYNRLVFLLRLAELLAVFGETSTSIKLSMRLADVVKKFKYHVEPNINNLFYGKRVAELLKLLGEHELASEIAEIAYHGATLLNDEPLRVELLELLISLEANQNKFNEWERCLYILRSHTCYSHLIKHASMEDRCATKLQVENHTSSCFNQLYECLMTRASRC